VALLASLAAVSACDSVSSENIESWKATVKGPAKLEDAVKSSGVSGELRAQAAWALVQIDQAEKVETALAAMPEAERGPLVDSLVPLLERAAIQGADDEQEKARDALFSVREVASAPKRSVIDEALWKVVRRDLERGRAVTGRHSLAKMAEAAGAPAAELLAEFIGDPKVNHHELAEIINKISEASGNDAARDTASTSLTLLARKLSPVPAGMWRALGILGGKDARQFLENKVRGGSQDESSKAMKALQQRKNPALLGFALGLASDRKARPIVREEAFGLAEMCCGAAAQAGLVDIIKTSDEEMVRYRAYEAALAAAGAGAIVAALDAFPAGKVKYKELDVQDYLVKDIEKLAARKPADGTAPPPLSPVLVKALSSPSVLTRTVAVWALEKVGGAGDARALAARSGDRDTVPGFSASRSVGREAGRVASFLSKGTK
jgi:hypothetical protein